MKRPDSFLLNTTAPAGRLQGAAKDDPGGDTGSGVTQEIYNDTAYSVIAMGESWKEGGISDSDETTSNSDMRDAIEEMASKKVFGISDWVIGTNYSTPGELSDLVMHKGFQFINISDVGNLGNDPLLFPKLWFKIPKVDKLMDDYYSAEPCSGGLSDLADRAGSKFLQNLLFGKYRLGGNGDDFYNFFRVALDGSVVTGDATLVAIFDVGGANEYPYLDLYAPDILGTRTLIDMGGRVTEAMTSGGVVDTLAEVHDDVMMRITGTTGGGSLDHIITRGTLTLTGVFAGSSQTTPGVFGGGSAGALLTDMDFDSANSVSPNPAKTNDDRTAHAALVTGISYIVVMRAA